MTSDDEDDRSDSGVHPEPLLDIEILSTSEEEEDGEGRDVEDEEAGEEGNKDDKAAEAGEELTWGCKHYRRRCALVCPTCDEVFTCRLCHDEVKDTLAEGKHAHQLDRAKVQEVVCLLCQTRQGVSNECVSCGTTFAKHYYCEKCRLFDDVDKGQYHCDSCRICRVGGRENYFHCETCQACFHIGMKDDHVCVERSLHQNCPICFEFLFSSTKQITILPCGHSIHKLCYLQMRNSFLRSGDVFQFLRANSCPTCSKSVCDLSSVWEQIDNEVAMMPMPEEYKNTKCSILCNDCTERSQVNFHVLALKCQLCGSYNTKRT